MTLSWPWLSSAKKVYRSPLCSSVDIEPPDGRFPAECFSLLERPVVRNIPRLLTAHPVESKYITKMKSSIDLIKEMVYNPPYGYVCGTRRSDKKEHFRTPCHQW